MRPSDPILRTARLELQPIRDDDGEALLDLLSLGPVRRYMLDGEAPDAVWIAEVVSDSRGDFARAGLGLWGARRADVPSLVGLVGFRHLRAPPVEELIFALHPDAWGCGLATEMAQAAIAHAFSAAGRVRVRASADLPNAASLRVLRRLGMREVGREPVPEGCLWDQVHCELDRAQWRAR